MAKPASLPVSAANQQVKRVVVSPDGSHALEPLNRGGGRWAVGDRPEERVGLVPRPVARV